MGLEISLLGQFEVSLDGEPINGFKTAKVRALLAYLAAEPGRPHQRNQLAGLLWPDWPQGSALSNLRSALADLRRVIGDRETDPPFLAITRQTIQLNPDGGCWVDVSAFEADSRPLTDDRDPNAAFNHLQSAVECYRGEFLEGFSLSDSPDFEEWILSKRQYYRQQALEMLGALAEKCEQAGDYDQGLAYTRRQLALEPWLEEAHRWVMRLLVLAGRRSEALAQFETCRKVLQSELNAQPANETVQLVEQIRSGTFETEVQPPDKLTVQVEHKHNLPLELTTFIGREKEIEAVCGLLSANRMVTLTGVGGTGKTRLSLQVAGLVLENYPNGAWLVELAGLSNPAMVPRTVASALNLPEIPGKSTTDSLVDFLRAKRLLLILDNCEHLLDACTSLADRLLRACPDLTILASSREFLGVTGEVPYRLPPMALPDARQGDVAQLSAYDAVKLFVERARVVVPDFAVTVENAPAVIQVVERLDGIPLAIELAAARLRLLSVAQVAKRLDDAFRLLTGGGRSTLPHHQTLRASIDWSYNLLSVQERLLLRRLSVFSASWRLSAAERVCADPPETEARIHPDEVLDLVTGLLDKSLIQTVRTSDGTNRFRMLETVRQYAHEKLVDEGESKAVRDRHLAYYLEWVEETAPKIRGREQVQTLDLLEIELDNLRLALAWALQTDLEAELKIASLLMWFWHIRSYSSEAITWLEQGLDRVEMDPGLGSSIDLLVLARAMTALGFFRWLQVASVSGQVEYAPERAKNLFEMAVSLYSDPDIEQNPDAKLGLSWANLCFGYYLSDTEGDHERIGVLAEDALGVFRAAGDRVGAANSLQLLARISDTLDQRIQLLQDMLANYKQVMDPHGMSVAYDMIAGDALWMGEYASALEAFKASLVLAQQVNDLNRISIENLGIGNSLHALGELESAEDYIQRSLTGWQEIGLANRVQWSLEALAQLRIVQGRYDEAAEICDQVMDIAQKSGVNALLAIAFILSSQLARQRGDVTLAGKHLDALLLLEDISGHHRFQISVEWGHLALQVGDLMQAGKRFREALKFLDRSTYHMYLPPFFDGAATYAARMGIVEAAARLFGSRWCRGYVHFLSPVEKEWREGDWAAMRDALGEGRFEALYEEGESLTYEQALALAQEVLEV